VRIRSQPPRCSSSRTARDFPAHRPGHGLSASSGDTAMRYTPSSCTLLLCMLLPCTAPSAAGLALAPALPHRSRARPNRMCSWPASRLAYTARLLLARCHATAAAPPAPAPRACTVSCSCIHAPAPPPSAPARVAAQPARLRRSCSDPVPAAPSAPRACAACPC
jgi:hypothetical protein